MLSLPIFSNEGENFGPILLLLLGLAAENGLLLELELEGVDENSIEWLV